MISKCTIIIPTFNRPKYLKRILNYYNGFEEDYNIIIADSSFDKNKQLNKETISKLSKLDISYIEKYPTNVSPCHKLADATNQAKTKYSVFCGDDDFITPRGINQSVDFLEKNQDFTVAHGQYISFYLRTNKKGRQQFLWNHLYLAKQINFPEARYRLFFHLSDYQIPTFYAVHKTDFLKMIFKETIKYTDDERFGELLPSMLTLIYGKMKRIDVPYGVREIIIDSRGRTSKNLDDFIKDRTYDRKYKKFKTCLAKHLTNNSQISINESKKIIDEAMSIYFKKSCSKSFKRILIDKMSNLLNALDLPDSIDKNIRMLYRKMFTPRHVLNRSKEIDDLKKKVESPNSEYFDDFNKIRHFVLQYAEEFK